MARLGKQRLGMSEVGLLLAERYNEYFRSEGVKRISLQKKEEPRRGVVSESPRKDCSQPKHIVTASHCSSQQINELSNIKILWCKKKISKYFPTGYKNKYEKCGGNRANNSKTVFCYKCRLDSSQKEKKLSRY